MISTTTTAIAVILLSLGIASLALAAVAGRFSVRGSARRAVALSILGLVALAGVVAVLWGEGWASVRGELLWPLTVHLLAALSGAGLALFIIYGLVAAR
ncbi:MAG: hypothetical protein JSW25_02430 [Thermoplasmata archaeon]|nr:MAG: hypothetical protein JSW25_02430 [Thermoplasmata archaeon]